MGWVADNIVGLATDGLGNGKSYAEAFLQSPVRRALPFHCASAAFLLCDSVLPCGPPQVLRAATHHVVQNRSLGFWTGAGPRNMDCPPKR